ncbi:MAG: class I adenylate cyclase, partial [Leptospirales bacterium]|nr:class I adenylate cyclase [Leptospirales bacterium]
MSTEEKNEIISQIKEKRDIFIKYNDEKINSLYRSFNSPELVNFFNYIPFLFTVNNPELPGYISEIETPHGISNYKIPVDLLSKLKVSNSSLDLERVNSQKPLITLFALIGSAGTIAFNPDSDLDFWICGSYSKVDKETMLLLRRKCAMIERWAAESYKKEVHFFINDIDHIKMNIFDKDEEYDLSTTSLGQTLKEEFYRSSIIINDVIPFWWVVPPGCSDSQYAEWLSAIKDNTHEKEFIDLGNIAGVQKGDFLIAALFQIIKSLGNPFKSIIKLGLLERYINGNEKNPFISNIIKKNINDGKNEKLDVDAYCLMFDQVYGYYKTYIDDLTSINIIRTCFYLKINPRLSIVEKNEKNSGDDIVKKIMRQYAKDWGWDNDIVKRIDSFKNWDIESTEKIMNNTKKVILKGYKNILSALGSEVDAESIDKDSLLAINRKIYSHFSPEDKKIDNTLNFKKYPPEKLLSLDYVVDSKSIGQWFLNKRTIINEKAAKVLIKKSPHLLSLIVWISLNNLYTRDFTRLDIEHGIYNLDPNYIRDLIADLSSNFSIKSLHLHNSFFLRAAFPMLSYIIINPFQKYAKRPDEIFFLYHNSWGETRFESYNTYNAVPELICRAINGALLSGVENVNTLYVTSSDPFVATKEFSILKSTIKKLFSFFTEKKTKVKQRFLTMIGDKYT